MKQKLAYYQWNKNLPPINETNTYILSMKQTKTCTLSMKQTKTCILSTKQTNKKCFHRVYLFRTVPHSRVNQPGQAWSSAPVFIPEYFTTSNYTTSLSTAPSSTPPPTPFRPPDLLQDLHGGVNEFLICSTDLSRYRHAPTACFLSRLGVIFLATSAKKKKKKSQAKSSCSIRPYPGA